MIIVVELIMTFKLGWTCTAYNICQLVTDRSCQIWEYNVDKRDQSNGGYNPNYHICKSS